MAIDNLPGFRRTFIVTPEAQRVTAAVEDDYHCMAVTLLHDGETIAEAIADLHRAPWTTCPGAEAKLVETFTGLPLADARRAGEKQLNCTHLHDLGTMAARHAHDPAPTRFEMLVADAVDGIVASEIRRDGIAIHQWTLRDDVMQGPDAAKGLNLFQLRDWIKAMPEDKAEAARLLQWGTLIAHGRAIPIANQSDASKMPPNCFTFQPGRKERATRVGRIHDFTDEPVEPLDHFDGEGFAARAD